MVGGDFETKTRLELLRGRWFGLFFPPFLIHNAFGILPVLVSLFLKAKHGYRANVTLLAVKVTLIEPRCPSHSVAPKGFNAG